ncbi:hypothetical protein [Roseovarius salis]|uniref:hypothetical protein n=1 Tax=Roseovarius salis TaxID=3376063 RepID=UPI0037CC070A
MAVLFPIWREPKALAARYKAESGKFANLSHGLYQKLQNRKPRTSMRSSRPPGALREEARKG